MNEEEARIMIGAEVNKGQILVVLGMVMSAYRRGRREAIEETVNWLELTVYPGKRGASLARRLQDRERSLAHAREAKGPARGE